VADSGQARPGRGLLAAGSPGNLGPGSPPSDKPGRLSHEPGSNQPIVARPRLCRYDPHDRPNRSRSRRGYSSPATILPTGAR
jgi:hypothetical protein